jgi:hypothetical protein
VRQLRRHWRIARSLALWALFSLVITIVVLVVLFGLLYLAQHLT